MASQACYKTTRPRPNKKRFWPDQTKYKSYFFNTDLLRYHYYEKDYIDDSTTDNTTWHMKIYV